jgi:hypothetical protein
MRSVFLREEGIDGLTDVNGAGTAAGLTARDRNYPERWALQSRTDWLR